MSCSVFFFLSVGRRPRATRTDTLFPHTTLSRSLAARRDTTLEELREALGREGVTVSRSAVDRYLTSRGLTRKKRRATPPSRSARRSEEHTSELQSLMRISYAVFCLKKKTTPRRYNRSSTSVTLHITYQSIS